MKRIEQHRQFNFSNIDYDYSLLELVEKINFTDSVQPIRLPSVFDKIRDGSICLVTGWGNTMNTSESRDSLRGANVPIVNQRKCSQQYMRYGGITGRMICAGYDRGGKDGTYISKLNGLGLGD